MSVAPEECSRRIAKGIDKSKLTENDVAADIYSSGNSLLRDECPQVSQPIDKPIDEIPADSQHTVGDNGVKTNEVSQGMHLIRVGVTNPDAQCVPVYDLELMSLDAPSNEPTPLIHGSASSISTPGLLPTMPLYMFDPTSLLMGSFDNQYGKQDFGNSTDIDCTLQGPDELQIQGNMTSDLWFNSLPNFLSTIQSAPMDNESPLLPGPLPNGDTHELYSLGAYSSSLLPLDVVPIHDVNPPPSIPLPGAIDPHTAPLLASVLAQECPPHAPSTSIQFPTDPFLGSLGGGKAPEAVADGGHGANTRGRARKRKADDSLVGMKDHDSGASNPRKKIANNTGETVEEVVTEATTERKEADRLAKEAKTAQEVAKEAAKAAKVAAKAAKAAKEAAKPAPEARRSARLHTLPDHLKEAGHTPSTRNLRGNTKGT